jgi:hypothetical protein
MFLTIDVPAGLVQLSLDTISLTVGKLIASSPIACLHPINVRLLAGEPCRFASRKLAGSDSVRDPLTLILLPVVDPAATLSGSLTHGEG